MVAEVLDIKEVPYCKLMLHAAKYPLDSVCGILLGRQKVVQEAVPLFHTPLVMNPLLAVALDQIYIYAKEANMEVIGVYCANRRQDDLLIPESIMKLASQIEPKTKSDAIILLVWSEYFHNITR